MNKSQNKILVLINRQYERAKQSGDTDTLSDLLKQYQFSIQRNQPFTKQYFCIQCTALLIARKYTQLHFFILRNRALLQKPQQIFFQLSCLGEDQTINELVQKSIELTSKSDSQLKKYFVSSAKRYAIQTLARDYVTMQLDFLKQNYYLNNDDLIENGCKIDGKYVRLPEHSYQNNINQLLQTRIKQLSTVTSNVVKSVQSF